MTDARPDAAGPRTTPGPAAPPLDAAEAVAASPTAPPTAPPPDAVPAPDAVAAPDDIPTAPLSPPPTATTPPSNQAGPAGGTNRPSPRLTAAPDDIPTAPLSPPPPPRRAARPDDVPTAPLAGGPVSPGVVWRPEPTADTLPGPGPASATCAQCGAVVDPDGYCTQCGSRAKSPREHYAQAPADWVGGVCDIGLCHRHNEDALALRAGVAPRRAALVVCDGVTTSQDSDQASLAGARAAAEALWLASPQGLSGVPASAAAAMAQALRAAVRAADAAVVAATAPDSSNPASATLAAALVADDTIHWANLGDSRVYWLPETGQPVQLSRDHSLAQLQIDEGVPRDQAEASAGAHTITKWLGRDSAQPEPSLGQRPVDGPGWLLVCSDGLWNYASEPVALAAVLAGLSRRQPATAEPLALAQRLVDWANQQGGHDNVTVALARLDPQSEPTDNS